MTSVVGFYTEDKPFVESYSPRRSQRTLSKLWIRSRLNLRRRPKKKIPKRHACFVKKALERFKKCERCLAFPERVGPRILSIEMSLVISMRFIFGDDWIDAHVYRVLALRQWCNFSRMDVLDFVYLYTRTQSIQKQMVEYNIKSK